MSFEISVSGFSQQQFENAYTQLNNISEQLGVSLTIRWDQALQQIKVVGEERIGDESLTDEILDAIEFAILGEKASVDPGSVSWNAERNWWDCEGIGFDGNSVEVCIDSPIEGASKQGLKTLDRIRGKLNVLQSVWKEFASSVLLESYNKGWAMKSRPLDSEDFQSQLLLESICIDDDGRFSVYFGASELYPGHCVIVDVNATQIPFQSRLG